MYAFPFRNRIAQLLIVDTFSQWDQTRLRSQPITQCPIVQTWGDAQKSWAVMAIVDDNSLNLEAVSVDQVAILAL